MSTAPTGLEHAVPKVNQDVDTKHFGSGTKSLRNNRVAEKQQTIICSVDSWRRWKRGLAVKKTQVITWS